MAECRGHWDIWYHLWITGKISENYPCGCSGRIEDNAEYKSGKRLVISVDPHCSLDTKKIGRVLGYVRYVAATI